ncbi:unnamed protein product, partial [Staurois parvus]
MNESLLNTAQYIQHIRLSGITAPFTPTPTRQSGTWFSPPTTKLYSNQHSMNSREVKDYKSPL